MSVLTLALAALAAGAQGAPARTVVIPPNPEWIEVASDEEGRAYIDRHSISSANGVVRYTGRIIFNKPDDSGTLEIVHFDELSCSAHTFRILAFDALAANGTVVASLPTPGDPDKINPNSPNDKLVQQYCR